MYRKCTTEKASAQQRQFQHALLQSMLQIPYGEITVTGLCTQTGLSRKTFYRLFENKDDVLNALIDQTLQEMDEIIYAVCTLCRDHERAGFMEGIKVGLHLMNALWDQCI